MRTLIIWLFGAAFVVTVVVFMTRPEAVPFVHWVQQNGDVNSALAWLDQQGYPFGKYAPAFLIGLGALFLLTTYGQSSKIGELELIADNRRETIADLRQKLALANAQLEKLQLAPPQLPDDIEETLAVLESYVERLEGRIKEAALAGDDDLDWRPRADALLARARGAGHRVELVRQRKTGSDIASMLEDLLGARREVGAGTARIGNVNISDALSGATKEFDTAQGLVGRFDDNASLIDQAKERGEQLLSDIEDLLHKDGPVAKLRSLERQRDQIKNWIAQVGSAQSITDRLASVVKDLTEMEGTTDKIAPDLLRTRIDALYQRLAALALQFGHELPKSDE
jgi:hypothetical protein